MYLFLSFLALPPTTTESKYSLFIISHLVTIYMQWTKDFSIIRIYQQSVPFNYKYSQKLLAPKGGKQIDLYA